MEPKRRLLSITIGDTSYLTGYSPPDRPTPEQLAEMPYDEYLRTPEWRERRRQAILAADHHCQMCGDYRDLHVHHLTYERRGNEHPDDLVVVCAQCHAEIHRR